MAPNPDAAARRRADALVDEAMARTAQADIVGALRAWADALEIGPSPSQEAWARDILVRAQGRVYYGAAPSPPLPAPASPAWGCLWAGDVEAARRLVEPRPDDVEKLGVLGVAHVLERHPHAAIPLLDRALALGGGEEIALFRVRALLQLGRLDEAQRALAGLINGESMARRLLVASLQIRRAGDDRRLITRAKAQPYFLNGLFSTELPGVVGAGALDRALASRASVARLLDDVLDRMAGNLGPSPTFAETAPDGSRRFVPVHLPRGARAEAVVALDTLRYEGPAAAEAALEAVIAQNPRSTHGHCYLGELYLWLGRYDDAWREFVAARRVFPLDPPRWADIGMVAVTTLTGRYRRARLLALYARYHFTPAPGGTLPVYRGALRRRTGDIRGAIEDLQSALADKPSRLGVRIELCLALREAGLRSEAEPHLGVITRDAAPLLVDAADMLAIDWQREPARLSSDDVLEEAVRAMRGNRSSSTVTWFDRTGSMRLLHPTHALADAARRALSQRRPATTGGGPPGPPAPPLRRTAG